METIFESQYFEPIGRLNPNMSMYELYLKGFNKVKEFEGTNEFAHLFSELVDVASYIDSKTIREQCALELKRYAKSIGYNINVEIDSLEDEVEESEEE